MPPPPPVRTTPAHHHHHPPMPSPILRTALRHSSLQRDVITRSARPKDDRPSSGSSSGSGAGSSVVSSASGGSGSSVGGGSMTRKRVQIVTDSPYDELPPYRIHRNSIYKVSFPGRTWDIMMQGFRIALEYDNVFVCDHFLGRDNAERALTELRQLKETGQFERHMRRGPGEPSLNYACLYLMDQEDSHMQLDALVLMVYKLARYYCDNWDKVSVEVSYFPEGHRAQETKRSDSGRRQLKCIYYPNNDWNLQAPPMPDVMPEGVTGTLTVQNVHSRKPPHLIEPVFDRLVVFWGDALDHVISECPDERYGVTVWLRR